MEWTLVSKKNVKHLIHVLKVPKGNELLITIVRLELNGGRPKLLKLYVEDSIAFSTCIKKINNIIELDNEMYELMAIHCSKS